MDNKKKEQQLHFTQGEKNLIKGTNSFASFIKDLAKHELVKDANIFLGKVGKAVLKTKSTALDLATNIFISKEVDGKSVNKAIGTGVLETAGTILGDVAGGPVGGVAGNQLFSYLGKHIQNKPAIATTQLLKSSPTFNPVNIASKFKSLFDVKKTKKDVKFKTRKTDITAAVEEMNAKGSNSAAVQQAMAQNNAFQVIEHRPIVQANSGVPSWLATLSTIVGVASSAVAMGNIISRTPPQDGSGGGNYGGGSYPDSGSPNGGQSPSTTTETYAKIVNGDNYPSDPNTPKDIQDDLDAKYPRQHHTGGKVPGRGDVITILKGGETVRTEAQENELQEQLLKKHLEEFAPLISGQGDEQGQNNSNGFEQHSEKKSKKPILYDRTRYDEEMIISIIADAWKSNRSGFRKVLQAR